MSVCEAEIQTYLQAVGGKWDLHFGRNVQAGWTRHGEIAVQKLAAHSLVYKPVNQHNNCLSQFSYSEGKGTPPAIPFLNLSK